MKSVISNWHFYLMLACVLLPAKSFSQSMPLVADGRSWTVMRIEEKVGQQDTLRSRFMINGIAEVDGRTCYKLYMDEEFGWYLHETDGMVYSRGKESGVWHLEFDFNLDLGDTLHDNSIRDNEEVNPIIKIDSFSSQGIERRRFFYELMGGGIEAFCWIEGIGDFFTGPLRQTSYSMDGSFRFQAVEACYDGDICIYSLADFLAAKSSVVPVHTEISPFSSVFDLQGRPATAGHDGNKFRKGVYVRDGRKYAE